MMSRIPSMFFASLALFAGIVVVISLIIFVIFRIRACLSPGSDIDLYDDRTNTEFDEFWIEPEIYFERVKASNEVYDSEDETEYFNHINNAIKYGRIRKEDVSSHILDATEYSKYKKLYPSDD